MQRECRRILHIHHLQIVISLVVRLLPQHDLQEALESTMRQRTNLDGHDVLARRVDVTNLLPTSHLRQSVDLQNIVPNVRDGVLLLETGGESGGRKRIVLGGMPIAVFMATREKVCDRVIKGIVENRG